MKRPHIICHMMTSLDGRIDCAMTEQLRGVEEYYATLNQLNVLTTVSGRVTAELELALPGKFAAATHTPVGQEAFSKKVDADGYEVIVDTKGTLLWPDASGMDKPYLIITSEQASKEYLSYLDGQNISWIAVGEKRIDLARATEILAEQFGVTRMGVVGGPLINTAFLEAGLLDEISIVIGAGIDGRGGMSAVFDGRGENQAVRALQLEKVEAFDSGAVWLRYTVASANSTTSPC